MRKKNFYKRILTSFIILSISYVLLLTCIYFYKNISLTQQRTHHLSNQLVTSIGTDINSKVNFSINLTRSIPFDANVEGFVMNNLPYLNAVYVQNILKIYGTLYSKNEFEIFIYNPTKNFSVSSTSSGNKKLIANSLYLSLEEFDDILTEDAPRLRLIPLSNKLCVVNRHQYANFHEVFIFTVVDIGTMVKNSVDPYSSLHLYFNDSLLTRNNNIEQPSASKQLSSYLFNPDYVRAKLELVLYQPPLSIFQFIQSFFSYELLFIIPLMLISCLLIFKSSQYIYRPVKDLLNSIGLSELQADELDEFKKVENYLTVIQRNNKELTTQLSMDNVKLQKESMLRDLFYGVYNEENIQNKLLQLKLKPQSLVHILFVAEVISKKQLHESLNDENRLKKLQTLSIFENLMSSNHQFHLFELSGLRFSGVLLNTCDFADVLKTIINSIKLSLNIEVRVNWKIIDSELKDIGLHSLSLLEGLGMANNLEKDLKQSYYYPTDVEEILIDSTISGNSNYQDSILEMILYENLFNRALTHDHRSALILAIAATIQKVCANANIDLDNVFEDGKMIFISMKSTSNNKILSNMIKEYFSTILKYNCNRTLSGDVPESEFSNLQLAEYIHQNYRNDISLNDIAGYFNVTPSYMSFIFKSYTSRNFKDYLNWYRVEKAKEIMLCIPHMKISEIPEMIGCNNMQTFLRIFKKYEGITPTHYIKK